MNTDGMILTTSGRNLLTKAMTGKELRFTRGACGDGVLAPNGEPYELSRLISEKQSLAIQSINATRTGTCEVVLEVSNQDLIFGYFVREYGLFARDPDTGQEVLYAYANKGDLCGYLETFDGTNPINYTLSLIAVVEQSPNITAIINNSNSYVTISRLDSCISSLYAEGVTPMGFWTYSPNDDKRLRPLSLSETRKILLGIDDVASLVKRIEVLENNQAEILLSQEIQSLYPNATHYIIEDFKNINQVDLFSCKVTSIVAGDDSLDCDPISGILPLSYYTISDGINSEVVQIESVNLENNIQRVILSEPVKNSYNLETCTMSRTTANVSQRGAQTITENKSLSWSPDIIWKGQSESSSFSINLDSSAGNIKSFEISGSINLTSDGYITLGVL